MNSINAEHPLGKGEVVSSILTGSTTNPHEMGGFLSCLREHPATRYATEHEHDVSSRGKSVEFVRRAFVTQEGRTMGLEREWRALAFGYGAAVIAAVFLGVTWWIPAIATVVAMAIWATWP